MPSVKSNNAPTPKGARPRGMSPPNMSHELLLEIFDFACQLPSGLLEQNPIAHLQRADKIQVQRDSEPIVHRSTPSLLGKVCKTWREITQSSPNLWAHIHLAVASNSDTLDSQKQQVEEYLRRSSPSPLSIMLYMKETDHHWYPTNVVQLYASLVRESSRWHSIDMFIPYRYLNLLNIRYNHLPTLRRASIKLFTRGFEVAFIQHSPCIRELSLVCAQLPTTYTSHTHLTHLTASSSNTHWLWNLLRHAPNLRWCYLDNMSGPIYSPSNSDISTNANVPINMKHLETLIIRDCHVAGSVILPYITSVPVLRELRYTSQLQERLPLDAITSLINRSGCHLEILELEVEDLSLGCIIYGLRSVFKQIPTLTRLIMQFDVMDVDSQFTKAIAALLNPVDELPDSKSQSGCPTTKSAFSPHLQYFELRINASGRSIREILVMLRHRWVSGSSAGSNSDPALLTNGNGVSQGEFKFAKIVSARLPETCRSEAIHYLGDAIHEGMGLEFIHELPGE